MQAKNTPAEWTKAKLARRISGPGPYARQALAASVTRVTASARGSGTSAAGSDAKRREACSGLCECPRRPATPSRSGTSSTIRSGPAAARIRGSPPARLRSVCDRPLRRGRGRRRRESRRVADACNDRDHRLTPALDDRDRFAVVVEPRARNTNGKTSFSVCPSTRRAARERKSSLRSASNSESARKRSSAGSGVGWTIVVPSVRDVRRVELIEAGDIEKRRRVRGIQDLVPMSGNVRSNR